MSEREKAVLPHQILIMNLMFFNIMFPIISLLSEMEEIFLPIAITGSLSIILYIYLRAKKSNETRLIDANWKKVWKRCFFLLIAYAISSTIMLVCIFLASMQPDHQLASIMMVACTRIAAIPTLLVVTPLLIMSTKSMNQMRRGEVEASG